MAEVICCQKLRVEKVKCQILEWQKQSGEKLEWQKQSFPNKNTMKLPFTLFGQILLKPKSPETFKNIYKTKENILIIIGRFRIFCLTEIKIL